jgi:hypothetical protein
MNAYTLLQLVCDRVDGSDDLSQSLLAVDRSTRLAITGVTRRLVIDHPVDANVEYPELDALCTARARLSEVVLRGTAAEDIGGTFLSLSAWQQRKPRRHNIFATVERLEVDAAVAELTHVDALRAFECCAKLVEGSFDCSVRFQADRDSLARFEKASILVRAGAPTGCCGRCVNRRASSSRANTSVHGNFHASVYMNSSASDVVCVVPGRLDVHRGIFVSWRIVFVAPHPTWLLPAPWQCTSLRRADLSLLDVTPANVEQIVLAAPGLCELAVRGIIALPGGDDAATLALRAACPDAKRPLERLEIHSATPSVAGLAAVSRLLRDVCPGARVSFGDGAVSLVLDACTSTALSATLRMLSSRGGWLRLQSSAPNAAETARTLTLTWNDDRGAAVEADMSTALVACLGGSPGTVLLSKWKHIGYRVARAIARSGIASVVLNGDCALGRDASIASDPSQPETAFTAICLVRELLLVKPVVPTIVVKIDVAHACGKGGARVVNRTNGVTLWRLPFGNDASSSCVLVCRADVDKSPAAAMGVARCAMALAAAPSVESRVAIPVPSLSPRSRGAAVLAGRALERRLMERVRAVCTPLHPRVRPDTERAIRALCVSLARPSTRLCGCPPSGRSGALVLFQAPVGAIEGVVRAVARACGLAAELCDALGSDDGQTETDIPLEIAACVATQLHWDDAVLDEHESDGTVVARCGAVMGFVTARCAGATAAAAFKLTRRGVELLREAECVFQGYGGVRYPGDVSFLSMPSSQAAVLIGGRIVALSVSVDDAIRRASARLAQQLEKGAAAAAAYPEALARQAMQACARVMAETVAHKVHESACAFARSHAAMMSQLLGGTAANVNVGWLELPHAAGLAHSLRECGEQVSAMLNGTREDAACSNNSNNSNNDSPQVLAVIAGKVGAHVLSTVMCAVATSGSLDATGSLLRSFFSAAT